MIFAPAHFVREIGSAAIEAEMFWRGLQFAVVPGGGIGTTGGMVELLHNGRTTAGYMSLRGEAQGLAANSAAGAGVHMGLATWMPTAAPFSTFAFLVRRDTSTNIQHLVGNGALGAGGWSLQLNYGAGQIGFTRWGLGDNVSTSLGAVPNTGGRPSGVGMAYDGSNVRFFLNGRFQTVASGGLNNPSTNNLAVGRNNSSLQALVNTSIHVLYLWNRIVSDGEFMRLWAEDPWLPIRPDAAIYEFVAPPPVTRRRFQTLFIG